jgi:hypothetical protein
MDFVKNCLIDIAAGFIVVGIAATTMTIGDTPVHIYTYLNRSLIGECFIFGLAAGMMAVCRYGLYRLTSDVGVISLYIP